MVTKSMLLTTIKGFAIPEFLRPKNKINFLKLSYLVKILYFSSSPFKLLRSKMWNNLLKIFRLFLGLLNPTWKIFWSLEALNFTLNF